MHYLRFWVILPMLQVSNIPCFLCKKVSFGRFLSRLAWQFRKLLFSTSFVTNFEISYQDLLFQKNVTLLHL